MMQILKALMSDQVMEMVRTLTAIKYYWHIILREYSLNNDEKSTFEKFKEVDKQIGPCGDIRRKMLKKCFRTIVESVMPEGMRFNMYLTVNSNPDCNQEYRKLFDQPHATASANIKSPIFYQGDRIYFELGIDPEMKELVSSKKDVMKKLHSDMTLIIHDLISVRNRLFKTLDDINLFSFAKNPEKFRSKDFGKLLKHSKIVEHDKDFSIFEIWNIKRKKAEDKCYDEIC